ncbi:hypothetical protein PQX77_015239 [Marasmius sp. AFHP31]|nr:hypothetical protein PQX77_015239 [Marasmius sp. AFHP31]
MLSWYLLTQLILGVRSEELSVPSSWDTSASKASREERINRTAAAIDAFIESDSLFTSAQPPSNLSDSYWPYGEFLALTANFDIFTNQTRYKEIAQERFLPALQQTTLDTSRYGYAATRAYIAYQDDRFLNTAKGYWTSSNSLTISESKFNSAINLTCSKPGSNYTLIGGTFHSTSDRDHLITTGATADYLTLTVSLATSVSSDPDPTYMFWASQTGHFIRTALYQGSGKLYNNIVVGNSDCPTRRDSSNLALSDTAGTMQSLLLLASSSKNENLTDILRDIARYTTGSAWNSDDGVLDTQKVLAVTGSNTFQFSQRLIQSHFDLVRGDELASDLKAYLHTYLTVQASPLSTGIYNALVKLATFPSGVPNLYGPGMIPSEGQLNVEAQTLAITTLLGGVISSNDAVPHDDLGTTDATTPDTGSRIRLPIGAIVSGVVGGILGIVLVAVGSYCCLRRRRQSQPSLSTVEPYPTMSSSRMTPPPLSTVLPFRPGKYERTTASASPNISESMSSKHSILTPPGSATQQETQSSRMPREATTAELVTLLNQRLGLEPRDVNAEQWEGSPSPPDYSSQAGGGRT